MALIKTINFMAFRRWAQVISFFLVVGVFTLCAAVKKDKVWLYTPIALFGLAAVSRLIAFVFHDAALSTDKILVELILAGFLLFLVKRKENSFS